MGRATAAKMFNSAASMLAAAGDLPEIHDPAVVGEKKGLLRNCCVFLRKRKSIPPIWSIRC